MKKVIILHGWTYSLEKWQPFLELLKEKGIEPIMLNVPGLTSKNDQVWTMEKYVNWLKEIVNKEKNNVTLIGHSNGGRIAINFAIKYPEKVEKLILIDSAGIYNNRLPHKIKIFVFKAVAKIGKKITSSRILEDILYKLAREGDYRKSNPIMKQTMINLLNSDKNLNISQISIPTLIIWGREDKITPLSDGKLMHKLIHNNKLEIIENARHAPQFTDPKQIAEIIYEYI